MDARRGRGEQGGGRAIVYCVVPRDLAATLHEPLRRHFAADPSVEVLVERRGCDRRATEDRRADHALPGVERRRIRNLSGRRVAERRAGQLDAPAPPLPRSVRGHAARLTFVERLEPSERALEDVDTARLVTRFQAGEVPAFEELYSRYFDRVYGYLRSILRDPHEAEDAAQDVFSSAFEALAHYEFRQQPFRAWLVTVLRNRAIDHFRRERRLTFEDTAQINRQRELAEPGNGGAPEILSWITDRELVLFVERLPLPQRQVLLLRYLLDLTPREVAEVLGRSHDDVRTLQHRALRFLRARLQAVGREPRDRERRRVTRLPRDAFVLRRRRFAMLQR